MGNNNNKMEFPHRDLFNVNDENGFIVLSQLQLNDDVLRLILSLIPPEDLVFTCRLVCKNWCNIVDTEVWNDKLSKHPTLKQDKTVRLLPWHMKYWILKKELFHRNLIKNCSGQDQLNSWKVLKNGGNQWKIENPPSGTKFDPLIPSCFATSFHDCCKEQIIDLYQEGASKQLIEKIKPTITISEWYAGRWDCEAIYELSVDLILDSWLVVDSFVDRKHCGSRYGDEWQQVSYTFDDYDDGVRYVRFSHLGRDAQFWAGHYGSKMAKASVVLSMPERSDTPENPGSPDS